MDCLEKEFYEYCLTHDQPHLGKVMYAPQGNALRNGHQRRSRLRVLLFPLEFATWKRACHWTYAAQLGLEEGFAANNVEFFTIPVIQEVPSSSPASWLYYARQLCKDKRFDQVWLWLVHPQYDEEFLQWVEDVAPVRVGFSMESLEYSKQELEDHPHLNGRKRLVENQMRHMTHILACDEADTERINRQGLCKALWFPTAVPEKFLAASPVVHQGKAVFCGSVYRGRDNWLRHRNLQSLLANAVSKEHYTQYPRLFDEINRKCMNFLQQNRAADEAFLTDYLNVLRRIRCECFRLWLSGLQTGCAIVNLPHLFKSYAGRVVEAMAAGRPVISWQIPNRPRTSALFENGKEILLFDQSKPEQLENHIQHLQNDPDFARRMAENALRKVTGFHTVEKRVRQVLDWIETGTEPAFGETEQQRESSREPQGITESADEVEKSVCNQGELADYGFLERNMNSPAESGDAHADESYFIKRGYQRNLDPSGNANPYFDDIENSSSYQAAVYRFAADLISEKGLANVLDIGCGFGMKLGKYIYPVCHDITGVDLEHAITFCKKEHDFGKWFAEDIEYPSLSLDKKFDLIISADVIEHLVSPNKLLDYIHLHSHPETLVVLSTPERDVTRGEESLGPPANPAHVREWNTSELRKYISSCGFSVLESFVVKDRDDAAVEKCQVILCRPGVHSQQRWMREPDLVKHHTSTADVQPEDIGQRHTADNALDCFAKATEESYKGHFETAVECMHKYRTTVDYSKFTRTFAGSRQDQKTDVSVIVVTYNRSEDLKRCLISLSRQDRVDRDFEVIVVDNGGSDFESLKQYVDQYIECPINFNLSEGRNIGVCCAKGRIVAFLDDDAVVPPDYVSSIKAAFETYDIFGLRGKALPKSNPEANKDATGYDHGDKPFATFCDLEGNSAFLRDVYLSMNGMDPLLFGHEGSDLTYRIAQKYNALNKVIYWPRTVIYHDAVAGDCLQTKKDRYELMDKYLKSKHGVDISRLRKTIENQPLPQRAPKFSFVMIVLNGIPLIEYSLKSIYDFAHEIIIVEGAVQDCMFAANADGSSKDGTVQFIKSFPDPANKIKLIQGKWPEKCEMQNEALKYVTGNYVWLIDSDEVYKRQDLEKLREILKQDPSITQVNFIPDNFWKGLDYTFVSHKFFEEPHHYRRLFKYQPGALFTSHRPPTMLWPGSKKTTENMHLLDGKTTRQMGIVLYHYSYVLDKQAKQKIELYHRYGWGKNWNVDLLQWYNECFLKWTSANRRQIDAEYPIWTGDVNSHTLPFQGSHPQVMIDYILNRSVLNHGISDANHIMHHVVAAVEEIKNRFNSEPILAIETGTIRSYDENHVSTYHIAKALANSGRLISVDISTDSIRRSGNICYEATNIELVQSDSVQYLSKLQDHKFHFAFLDSVNDKDVIFEEFSLIVPMMEEHAILMVDDAGITGDGCSIDTTVAAQKGHRIWQFLTACGVHPSILDTPGGHGTQLKVVLTGDNLARIKQGLCSFDSRSVCHGSALDMPDAPNADYNNNKKKVLIVRSDSIGDFVIFGGAIPYYRKIYPNAHVAVVVAETVAELAEACPFIDEVITFNRPKICSQPEYAAEFISLIRQKKFDVAICPAFSRDKVSEYIAINSGAAEKITCSGDTANLPADIIEADNAHFTKVIPMSEGIALETFRNEEFLRELGVELDGAYRPAVWVTKADREAAQQLLSRRRIRQPIVVVPFAQLDIRNWPVRNWAKLVSMYADVPVIICGTEKDKQAADKIAEQANHPNIYNLCGLTTVRQLAALIAQSRLCIGGESAAAHFAAVANQPHVVVIGGGHFGRFMPYSSQTKLVYNRMDCFNCNWQCKHGRDIRCIGSISVAMVQRAVNEALGTIRQEPALDSGKLIAPREENTPGKSDYLVSAIVSTYNSEKYIRACLEDLESQTIAERLEIIVVNSGSQQNEEAVIRQYQQNYNNIIYIKTDEREGIYTAWNRAVKLARGQFLTNANTDDRHRPDALEIMANTLQANPDIALVYGDQIRTDTPNDTFADNRGTEMLQRPDYNRQRLLLGCCVGSQPMWRRSLHNEFGYFDETLTCAGDWDFWLRISSKYKFKHIPEFLGLYYHNEDGIEHGRKIHSLYERYIVGKRYGTPYISVIPLYESSDNPLVSVIMPAYNAAEHVAEAIESVLIQNYRNFELVVVNDGSTDNTEDIVAHFKDDRIKYFHKQNGGAASARNLAIKKSRGDFIVNLDTDDMITPDFIAKHLQEVERHPQADLVYCDDCLINENGKPIRVIERPEYSERRLLIRDLFRCGFPIVPFRTFIRRSVFDKIGLYDEQLSVAEDYDMMRRFVRDDLKIHHLKGALYLRRMTSDSLSRSFTTRNAKSHFDVVRRFAETFAYDELFPDVAWDNIPPQIRPLHAKCLAAMTYLAIGQAYIESNSPPYVEAALERACSELNNCLKTDPGNLRVQQLLQKCESVRTRYEQMVQQPVC